MCVWEREAERHRERPTRIYIEREASREEARDTTERETRIKRDKRQRKRDEEKDGGERHTHIERERERDKGERERQAKKRQET